MFNCFCGETDHDKTQYVNILFPDNMCIYCADFPQKIRILLPCANMYELAAPSKRDCIS